MNAWKWKNAFEAFHELIRIRFAAEFNGVVFCPQVTVVAKACRETAPEATKYTEVAPNEQSEARNDLDFAELFLLVFSIVLLCFLLPGS